MKVTFVSILVCTCILLCLSAFAEETRAINLFKEVRCLVCQGQTIHESNAEIAEDLKTLIREKIGVDTSGRSAINLGVYGVPETFIIQDGIIIYKHIGPIHMNELDEKILPLIKDL